MSTVRRATSLLVLASLLAVGIPAGAEEPAADYGDTYTSEELAALDRALHAVNMERGDLTFDKDKTKGHACFAAVREMLRDPLSIAPRMDELAGAAFGDVYGPGLGRVLNEASRLYGPGDAARVRTPGLDSLSFSTAAECVEWWRHRLEHVARTLPLFEEEPTELELQALRLALPTEMAWHDVFVSPYAVEIEDRVEAFRDEQTDDWSHALAARIDVPALLATWQATFGVAVHSMDLEFGAYPKDRPYVVPTPYGRIAIGTFGDDVYEGEYAVLIDPGGNDRYVDCVIGAADIAEGRPVGFFLDEGGDDVYACGDENLTLGAAVLGIAAFIDRGKGNDRYQGGHGTLGAAMGGVAVFYDDGGSDVYEGRTYTQGAAGFGIGVFYDGAAGRPLDIPTDKETPDPIDIGRFDNDRLSAWSNAQAFARCKGVALCVNERGNEIYEAGGVYLHAPLFSDRYQSFSQGFAIGSRGIDYAGGIAMLIDGEGNDRYLGDIYNQGVGYWYGAGFLWDGGGNDLYEMTQYGQGSGIHLAVGGLVDVSGHDTYVMHSGLGQGGSHDYAASILHDRGGNDRYHGSTSCNGAALTNSVGLFFDRSGDDVYAGRRKGAINFGRPARGFSSIGVLVDLDGTDDYLGIMADDTLWRHADIGVGIDTRPAPVEEPAAGGVTPGADKPSGKAEIPEICSYEGELTQEVFDELWAISIRWEVGDNRVIVPEARKRLILFGADVLPMMDAVVEESASGLELRAFVDVLEGLGEAGHAEPVAAFLRSNLASNVARRKRIGLYLVGEMKANEMEADVVSLLGGDDEDLALRAAGVLKSLGSHAGDETLSAWLRDPEAGRKRHAGALSVLLGLGSDVYADARRFLDAPDLSIRTRLVTLLVGKADVYLDDVRDDLGSGAISDRARRTVLEVLVKTVPVPDQGDVLALVVLLDHDDWGVRADAARLIRAWQADETADEEILRLATEALDRLLERETDPYVRFCAGE